MKIGEKVLTWHDLCVHRSLWMGVAMLWIIIFHAPLAFTGKLFIIWKNSGYGGVDLFLFASGMGIYHSLTHDREPLCFLKRRFLRLVPIYLPFMAVWLPYRMLFTALPPTAALGNLFALEGFANPGMAFNWYITGLIVLYCLAPYFFAIIEKINNLWQLSALVAFAMLLSYAFWDCHDSIVIVTRIPIFLIGMYVAKISAAFPEKTVSPLAMFLLPFLSVVGAVIRQLFCACYEETILWDHGLYWYPFILIAPGVCVLLSLFAELLKSLHFLNWLFFVLEKIGEYSFEAYLIHIFLLNIYQVHIIPAFPWVQNNPMCVGVLLLIIPFSLALHWISRKIRTLFSQLFEKTTKQTSI